jgi:hypothetical protein
VSFNQFVCKFGHKHKTLADRDRCNEDTESDRHDNGWIVDMYVLEDLPAIAPAPTLDPTPDQQFGGFEGGESGGGGGGGSWADSPPPDTSTGPDIMTDDSGSGGGDGG